MRKVIICIVLWLVPTVVHSQESLPLPEKVQQLFNFQVGTWRTTPEGQTVFRWMPGKYCCIWSSQFDSGFSISGITGWDHASKRIVAHTFGSSGTTGITKWRILDNGEMDGESVVISPDGTQVTNTVRFSKKGRDEYVMTSTRNDGSVFEIRYERTGE